MSVHELRALAQRVTHDNPALAAELCAVASMGRRFDSIEDVIRANQAAGQHFFDPATLRFFRSRCGRELYGGLYFVTSEQFDAHAPRLYTVRKARADGRIETVGEFQQYRSGAAARMAALRLAKELAA